MTRRAGYVSLRAIAFSSCLVIASGGAAAESQTVIVTGDLRIIDGDTLEVGPLMLRIHGIDAPEAGQSCATPNGGTWTCGAAASNRLAELIGSAPLDCDPLDRDNYGRLVSRCIVDGVDVGARLVAEGLAWAYVQYSSDYVSLEAAARAIGTGIWQAPTQTAKEYRDNVWERAVEVAPNGCPIKGNINGKKKIYHTPWSPNYGVTQINPDKGEAWFCTEAEALEAGWRQVQSR